jgi:hypothetical protein
MYRGGLEMAITYAHLYCGIAASVERDVRCCGKIMQSRRFQTNTSVFSGGSSGVGMLALWRHGCGRPTRTLRCRGITCPCRRSTSGPKRSANSCSSCPLGYGDLVFPRSRRPQAPSQWTLIRMRNFSPWWCSINRKVVGREASFGTPVRASQASSGESGYVEVYEAYRDTDDSGGVNHWQRGAGICLEWGVWVSGIWVSPVWLLSL